MEIMIISGKVPGINGKPISNARVNIAQANLDAKNPVLLNGTTNSFGCFFSAP